jgi:hypothetical protein
LPLRKEDGHDCCQHRPRIVEAGDDKYFGGNRFIYERPSYQIRDCVFNLVGSNENKDDKVEAAQEFNRLPTDTVNHANPTRKRAIYSPKNSMVCTVTESSTMPAIRHIRS